MWHSCLVHCCPHSRSRANCAICRKFWWLGSNKGDGSLRYVVSAEFRTSSIIGLPCSRYKKDENGAWEPMVMFFELRGPNLSYIPSPSFRSESSKLSTYGRICSGTRCDGDQWLCFLTSPNSCCLVIRHIGKQSLL